MKSTLLVSTGVLTLSLFTGCIPGGSAKEAPAEKIVAGMVQGRVYSNSYFDIKVHSPEGWEIQDQAPVKGTNPFQVDLFQAFEYPLDSGYIDNGNIYITAERRNHNPMMDDGGDYLLELKEGLEMLALETDEISEITTTTIDGKKFHRLSTYGIDSDNDVETVQEFYATPIKDYWLMITLTYCDKGQKASLKETLEGIEFK
ncbi:MAG: hypothetical protein V4604_11350 [Bacteroidota bacterium]